jgi:pSer/pThr/pTyr-binding forkhead associated (FHA) protein
MTSRLDLVVRHTDRRVALALGQTITAGRTPQCDLQLDDPSASRRHRALAHATASVLDVKDLESANGKQAPE